jgi:release factor glutamine methyltransferase
LPKTYNDLYLETRRLLRDNGIDSYNLEARIIVSQAADKTMEKFLQGLNYYTANDTAARVDELVARRLAGEPVAYLTGRWEFYGIPVEVTRDVLIPRTDTETLVDQTLSLLGGGKMDARVLDLCAGSGCIGCAVAVKSPATRVVMADNSKDALNVCRRNVSLNNLGVRCTCVEADIFETPPILLGSFDILVCNPPYIPTADIAWLDVSVREYEPLSALDGGEDGLDYYRAAIKNWKTVIRDGGSILFEVGIGQAQEVMQMLRLAAFRHVECFEDTGGIERVVAARL